MKEDREPLPEASGAEVQQPKTTRRQRWKAAKKQRRAAKRAARREYYKDAPLLVKAWNFWLKKLLAVLVIAVLVLHIGVPAFLDSDLAASLLMSYIEKLESRPVDKETIYEMSPLDGQGSARIDASEPYGKDDTWGIYVYMVGSNLEDQDENDLSDLTRAMTSGISYENSVSTQERRLGYLDTFIGELERSGLEMPEYLYKPNVPLSSSSTYVTEDVVLASGMGAASADIYEMTSDVWSSNISIVIQTGGATHWTNSMVNPNKTQRFLYKDGVFSEVSNLPLQDSCSPETLAQFMRFCDGNYPADHRILILWDHGSGAAGFGYDSIFSSGLSLEDLRGAFEAVYAPDTAAPAYDIIGFDACLMASAEVAHSLDGFAEYLVASEELEPGDGWDYGAWLRAMTDDASMNAAQVGRAIADSYIDYYMTFNANLGSLIGNQEVTMSVTDVHKAALAYEAYCKLCRAQLRDAAGDLGVLADIGRKAGSATRYGSYVYDRVNAVDLGGYMDLLDDTYPDEAQEVRTLLREAVLYHRESAALADSQGLSVFVPVETSTLGGLIGCMEFIYDICPDENVSALYYYKIAGCLNEEMSEYAAELSGREPEVLDVSVFSGIEHIDPVIGEGLWSVPVDEKLRSMIQGCSLELAYYDEALETVTYYGRDEYIVADGDGSLVNEFDGKWIALDGVPLSTEIVSSSASSVEYRSKVRCEGEDCYLMFTYSRDSERFSISGLKKIQTGDDTILMLNTRQLDTVAAGKTVMPIYSAHSFSDGYDYEFTGDRIRIGSGSEITLEPLPDGTYLGAIVISDPRGDSYYSGVVGQEVNGGVITAQELRTDFYAAD